MQNTCFVLLCFPEDRRIKFYNGSTGHQNDTGEAAFVPVLVRIGPQRPQALKIKPPSAQRCPALWHHRFPHWLLSHFFDSDMLNDSVNPFQTQSQKKMWLINQPLRCWFCVTLVNFVVLWNAQLSFGKGPKNHTIQSDQIHVHWACHCSFFKQSFLQVTSGKNTPLHQF